MVYLQQVSCSSSLRSDPFSVIVFSRAQAIEGSILTKTAVCQNSGEAGAQSRQTATDLVKASFDWPGCGDLFVAFNKWVLRDFTALLSQLSVWTR